MKVLDRIRKQGYAVHDLVAVAIVIALFLWVVVAAVAQPVREPCMIDDMEEIIGSRQTVEFSLTTSRITGEAQVLISGPGYLIKCDGVPSDWPKLLERAISDWREATRGEAKPEWGTIKAMYR